MLYEVITGAKPGTQAHCRAWIGGGKGWKVRCGIPNTNGEWRRISKTFITQDDETMYVHGDSHFGVV